MENFNLPSSNGQGHDIVLPEPENNESAQRSPFIESNTEAVSIPEMMRMHIIPSYRDATPLISHSDFVQLTEEVVHEIFSPELIATPSVRVSHCILGRHASAKDKTVEQLQPEERTVYFERCMFIITLPLLTHVINGQTVCLTVGGVRKYDTNLRAGSDQHFKVFIGYQVQVCCNLCVVTDGLLNDIRVKNLQQLREAIYQLLVDFDSLNQLRQLEAFQNYTISERQFAQLIGRCRMYQYLPSGSKASVPELQFGDSQINSVCRDYYKDGSFCRDENGDINLWRLYNLFTAANKQSYVDTFLDRSVNASSFVEQLAYALEHKSTNWFLS